MYRCQQRRIRGGSAAQIICFNYLCFFVTSSNTDQNAAPPVLPSDSIYLLCILMPEAYVTVTRSFEAWNILVWSIYWIILQRQMKCPTGYRTILQISCPSYGLCAPGLCSTLESTLPISCSIQVEFLWNFIINEKVLVLIGIYIFSLESFPHADQLPLSCLGAVSSPLSA